MREARGPGALRNCHVQAQKKAHGLRHKPFWHSSPDVHCELSVQDFGQGPTALTGADVNSVREPIAQNISTGRPSQPQRPPGSMHELFPLGTTHLPLLLQPPTNPHRWPEGHCESFVQFRAFCVLRVVEIFAVIDWAWTFTHPARMHKHKARMWVGDKQIMLIAL
jgi:hypothetical protein